MEQVVPGGYAWLQCNHARKREIALIIQLDGLAR